MPTTLCERADAVLRAPDPADKVALSHRTAAAWRAGAIAEIGRARPPDRPARPDRPRLLPPREMPKRRAGASRAGRVALLHALTHIELNAIDLAWDLVARFGHEHLPSAFYDDWVGVADDEARHFEMLRRRLGAFGAEYGDLPAHDGLWQAARDTAHDIFARLAVVPLVLEARGLDVTPAMIERLERFGDEESAGLLKIILAEEIAHVAAGQRWLEHLCRRDGADPVAIWRHRVGLHFKGRIKPPFNRAARQEAGLPPEMCG